MEILTKDYETIRPRAQNRSKPYSEGIQTVLKRVKTAPDLQSKQYAEL